MSELPIRRTRKRIVRWPKPIGCAHCHRDIPKSRMHIVVCELGVVLCGDCVLSASSSKPVHARLFPDCEPWHDMYDHKTLSAHSRDLAASALVYFVDESVRWSLTGADRVPDTRTAAELVIMGECSGMCLVARSKVCTCACACGGAHHGALADALIGGRNVHPNMAELG